MSRKFSPSDDLRLVNSVKAFPVLFNHERFFVTKNPDIIRENWRVVAEEVGRGEEACKKRWRDIRDHYFKVLRKQQNSRNRSWTTRWPLYSSLAFLAHARRKKRHLYEDSDQDADVFPGDIYQPETTIKEEDSQEPSLEIVDVDVSHRITDTTDRGSDSPREDSSWGAHTLLDVLQETRSEEDDVDVFMRSIAMTVKRLEPRTRAEAKLKILSVVTELEFPMGCVNKE